jgi:phenolic acid decarboxylase
MSVFYVGKEAFIGAYVIYDYMRCWNFKIYLFRRLHLFSLDQNQH